EAPVIFSYHPWSDLCLRRFPTRCKRQASFFRCAAEDISACSPRSALDSVCGGLDDWLAKGLGKDQVAALVGQKLDANGKSEGAEG
ncbi:hypothetical protein EV421DRAFT_1716408, partial [Armillaria borealis]